MKKSARLSQQREIKKALNRFPSIVARNKTNYAKKQKFIEKTFGELARAVHREVQGKTKRPLRGNSG